MKLSKKIIAIVAIITCVIISIMVVTLAQPKYYKLSDVFSLKVKSLVMQENEDGTQGSAKQIDLDLSDFESSENKLTPSKYEYIYFYASNYQKISVSTNKIHFKVLSNIDMTDDNAVELLILVRNSKVKNGYLYYTSDFKMAKGEIKDIDLNVDFLPESALSSSSTPLIEIKMFNTEITTSFSIFDMKLSK
jgi:hypothetical protein